MCRKSASRISYVLLASMMSLFVSCRDGILTQRPGDDTEAPLNGVVILYTDSNEWRVHIFETGVLYNSGYEVDSPFVLPTKADAQVLRHYSYAGSSQRFVTSDGYTFGMPSASVTKAGSKTRYSVLGLWKRSTTIDVEF